MPLEGEALEVALAIALDCEWREGARFASQVVRPAPDAEATPLAFVVDGERADRGTSAEGGRAAPDGSQAGRRARRRDPPRTPGRSSPGGTFAHGVWRGAVGAAGEAHPVVARVAREDTGWRIERRGSSALVRVLPPHVADLLPILPEPDPMAGLNELRSPMPGTVVSVAVSAGDRVAAGQRVAVVEAMKMENALTAEHDAVVAEVLVEAGAAVAVDQPIVRFEAG